MEKDKTGKPVYRTGRYLKYAIGEIILVVIGILIALSINNWNEDRKRKNELSDILITVRNDLKTDTLNLSNNLLNYKNINQRIQKLLDREIPKTYFDTINVGNFDLCEFCVHNANTYNHIFIQSKGFELLNKFTSTSSDTLLSSLLSFHKKYEEFFVDDNNILKELARNNGQLLEKYDWYADFRAHKYNADYLEYIFESIEYRNKLSTYKTFSDLAISDLNDYKKAAISYIKLLEEMYPEN